MRAYTPKDDVQAKAYYTDRFYVAPQVPKSDVATDEVFASDLEAIKAKFEVHDAYIQVGQMVVFINPQDNYGVLELLRDELEYTQLSEMSAVDFVAQRGGFEIFYQMLSMNKRKRIRIKMFINNGEAVNSVEKLFRSADWSEREMYDMFGIVANNHPFMKRILMPYDWQGHPLLKTYPLQGTSLPHGTKWTKSTEKKHATSSGRNFAMLRASTDTTPSVLRVLGLRCQKGLRSPTTCQEWSKATKKRAACL